MSLNGNRCWRVCSGEIVVSCAGGVRRMKEVGGSSFWQKSESREGAPAQRLGGDVENFVWQPHERR